MTQSPVVAYLENLRGECLELKSGELASYIPELANANPDHFGISLCTLDGTRYSAGDADVEFSIQSVSKPFVYAMALADRGLKTVLKAVDEEPSGDPFNSISLDEETGRPKNPMINIGALTTHALVHSRDASKEQRGERILAGMSAFAGRQLDYDQAVYESELGTSWRNLALAAMVRANSIFLADPYEVVDGYTLQCSINVTAADLAVMGMTLAAGGTNPITGEQVVPEWVAQQVMSLMTTCGMYDSAGDWLTNVGIPAKSGVSGGVLGALPGQVGAAVFSPPIDTYGNSVRGVRAFEKISTDLGLHMLRPPNPSAATVNIQDATGSESVLIEIQGSLDFAVAEKSLRSIIEIPAGSAPVVIDLTRVPFIAVAGRKLLLAGMRALQDAGHPVSILDPYKCVPDFVPTKLEGADIAVKFEDPTETEWFEQE